MTNTDELKAHVASLRQTATPGGPFAIVLDALDRAEGRVIEPVGDRRPSLYYCGLCLFRYADGSDDLTPDGICNLCRTALTWRADGPALQGVLGYLGNMSFDLQAALERIELLKADIDRRIAEIEPELRARLEIAIKARERANVRVVAAGRLVRACLRLRKRYSMCRDGDVTVSGLDSLWEALGHIDPAEYDNCDD